MSSATHIGQKFLNGTACTLLWPRDSLDRQAEVGSISARRDQHNTQCDHTYASYLAIGKPLALRLGSLSRILPFSILDILDDITHLSTQAQSISTSTAMGAVCID